MLAAPMNFWSVAPVCLIVGFVVATCPADPVLFQEDFEAGQAGDKLLESPYLWNDESNGATLEVDDADPLTIGSNLYFSGLSTGVRNFYRISRPFDPIESRFIFTAKVRIAEGLSNNVGIGITPPVVSGRKRGFFEYNPGAGGWIFISATLGDTASLSESFNIQATGTQEFVLRAEYSPTQLVATVDDSDPITFPFSQSHLDSIQKVVILVDSEDSLGQLDVDDILVVIPEPGSAVLIGLGAMALFKRCAAGDS